MSDTLDSASPGPLRSDGESVRNSAQTSATLCIDAGTTLIKAVVFDHSGQEVAIARRPTQVTSRSRGYAEQDMLEVWNAVVDSVAEAVAASPIPIGRVALTAQGDGAWFIGSDGEPIGPAMLWNDARARKVVDRWESDGTLDRAFAINGSLGNMGLPHAIMSTLLADDPTALDAASAVLTCGSWLFSKLTGTVGLHASEASAPWLDIAEGGYSPELFELYGLADQRHLVPPVLSDAEVNQPVLASVARQLGLPEKTPVVLAPYDVVSTAAGGGTVHDGAAFCILGTTLCTGIVTSAADTAGAAAGLTLRVSNAGPYIRAYPTLAGTGVIDWMSRMLGVTDAAAVVRLAAEAPPGSGGLGVWPYLSPAGERAPFLDGDARGVIAGLSFEHGREHLARATVEGLAHVVRDCLDASGVRPSELTISGGGSASDLWCETIADVTGVTTVRTGDSQLGAKGAMIHAAVATGEYASVADAAAALVVPADRFEPRPELVELHRVRHDDFIASRAAFAERWSTWTANAASAPAHRMAASD